MSKANKDKISTQTGAVSKELATFNAIPAKRKEKKQLSVDELEQVQRLLKTYMDVPSKRALPTKAQLSAVTSSLFKEGARKLSPKWNKTQLVVAIQHWLDEIKDLRDGKGQVETYLEVSVHKGAPNLMEHQISTEEECGKFASMAISSPSSRAKGPALPVVYSPQGKPEGEKIEGEVEHEPVPIYEESPSTFLEQFDRLLNDPELAIAAETDPLGETPRNVPASVELDPIPEIG